MKTIGITGGVGAGKSLVLDYIEKHYRAKVYLADEIANTLKLPGNLCYRDIVSLLGEDVVCCFGDTLVDSSIYNSSKFAIVKTRDYRAYLTGKNGHISKGSRLYKLIRAGSVFIADNYSTLEKSIENLNCRQTGFNIIVKNQEV